MWCTAQVLKTVVFIVQPFLRKQFSNPNIKMGASRLSKQNQCSLHMACGKAAEPGQAL
jgi:hypothetical protein